MSASPQDGLAVASFESGPAVLGSPYSKVTASLPLAFP
jgi:hypothetical protein